MPTEQSCANKNRLVTAYLMMAVLLMLSHFSSSVVAKVLEVKPATNVDERLFLTYVSNDLYGALPTNYSDEQLVTKELDDLRFRTNRYLEYLQKGGALTPAPAQWTGPKQAPNITS